MGDKAPIQNIKSITTLPLDLESGSWGLALLKLQANLPDALLGQNVTFLIYGNTTVDNTSGDMQAFYFSSGPIKCTTAPRDAIVVKSPNHTQVPFNANGVLITIASTIILKAVPHQSMSVQLVEGHAEVTTFQGTQTLKPGEEVNVPLGEDNGLHAIGAPSAPYDAPADTALDSIIAAVQRVARSLIARMTSTRSTEEGTKDPTPTKVPKTPAPTKTPNP